MPTIAQCGPGVIGEFGEHVMPQPAEMLHQLKFSEQTFLSLRELSLPDQASWPYVMVIHADRPPDFQYVR